MSTRTSIEWLAPDGTPGVSWNFLRGCSMISPGCTHCYAQAIAARFSGKGQPFEGLAVQTPHGPHWTGDVRYLPRVVREPLRWQTPTWVFVNSMSDLAHPAVQANWIDAMLAVIAATPQHTYIGLTKRPERLWRLLYAEAPDAAVRFLKPDHSLPNLILGTSVESEAYVSRVEALLAAWSGPTVVSAEPLLGPLDLRPYLPNPLWHDLPSWQSPTLSWVIVGGESGSGARPCRTAWIEALIDQCRAADTACFVKQLGRYPVCDAPTGRGPAVIRDQSRLDREWPPGTHFGNPTDDPALSGRVVLLRDRKGGDPSAWAEDLRVRQWPVLEGR